MAVNLPYVPTPGSIKTALERIKTAATPDRVTADFVQTKLQIKGGTGAALPSYLKKIGLVNSDGTPSAIYNKFRNSQTSSIAIVDAIKIGYRELFDVNEYCYVLADKELFSLICQVTGAAADSVPAKLMASCFKALKSFADFESKTPPMEAVESIPKLAPQLNLPQVDRSDRVGLNLSYTINLNLPATSDQAVFNAIFKSLKEHLLDGE